MDTKTCLLGVGLLGAAATLQAGEIVRWVDADGVVHFGDRQAAPARGAQTVEVQPTNGMAVAVAPKVAPVAGASMVRIDNKKVKNKRGFRGFESRPEPRRGRRH